jgi:hypothetical protein
MIVLGVDCTGRGHLSSVLEEVREPEVIGRKSVPGPLHNLSFAWDPLRLQQEREWADSRKYFLSVILGPRAWGSHVFFPYMPHEGFLMCWNLGNMKSPVCGEKLGEEEAGQGGSPQLSLCSFLHV